MSRAAVWVLLTHIALIGVGNSQADSGPCDTAVQRCMDIIGSGTNAKGQIVAELGSCPKTPQLAACLGTSHLMNGDIDAAVVDLGSAVGPLSEAVQSASDSSRPQKVEMATFCAHNLGIAQAASQRYAASVRSFRHALELHGANTTELLDQNIVESDPEAGQPQINVRLPAAAMPTVMALAFRALKPGTARTRLFRLILAHSLQRQAELAAAAAAAGGSVDSNEWAIERHRECETRFSLAAQQQELIGISKSLASPAQASFHSLSRCPCGAAAAVSSPLSLVYKSTREESLARAQLLAATSSLAMKQGALAQLNAACSSAMRDPRASEAAGGLPGLASLAGIHSLLGDAAYSSSYFGLNDAWIKHTILAATSRLIHTAISSYRPSNPHAVLGWGDSSPRTILAGLGPSKLATLSPYDPAEILARSSSPRVAKGAVFGRKRSSRRVRVCFVTAFTNRHSVAKMSLPLMLQLPRDLFEVAAVLAAPLGEDEVSQALLAAEQDGALLLSRGLAEGSGRIGATLLDIEEARSLRCDAAVFPELGMSVRVMGIAAARIAPFQVVTHGHSITSGLDDAIDAFVSLDAAELNETHLHLQLRPSGRSGRWTESLDRSGGGWRRYSEQLVRLRAAHSQFWEVPSLPDEHDEEQEQEEADALASSQAPASHADQAGSDTTRLGVTASSLLQWPELSLTQEGDVSVSKDVFASAGDLLRQVRESTGWQSTFAALTASGAELHANRPLILVPQAISKFHSSFDRVLLSILLAHPGAKLQLLQPSQPVQAVTVSERLLVATLLALEAGAGNTTAAFAGPAQSLLAHSLLSRLEFVSQRSHSRFQSLLADADVILDSHPFGGCTTSIEALLAGTPVVTLPDTHGLPGRFTQAILKAVDLQDWIATDAPGLVSLTLRVGVSRMYQSAKDRRRARATLAQRVRARLMSPLPLNEWSELLQRGVRASWMQILADATSAIAGQTQNASSDSAAVSDATPTVPGWSVELDIVSDSISYQSIESPVRHLAVNVTVQAQPSAILAEAAIGMQAIEASTFACVRAAFLAPACAPLEAVTLIAAVPATWRMSTELTIADPCAVACSLGHVTPDAGCICEAALTAEVSVVSNRQDTSAIPLAMTAQRLAAAKPNQA